MLDGFIYREITFGARRTIAAVPYSELQRRVPSGCVPPGVLCLMPSSPPNKDPTV